jgi:cysteine-rich repeat protein
LVLAVAACGKTEVDPNATAIEVTVRIDPTLGVDQLAISGTVAGATAFAPGTLPDTPRALDAEESFAILVPDALDGQQVLVRVDALAAGQLVMSGGVIAPVQLHHVSDVAVTLGAPAICGDGIVSDLLETCDDGNTKAGDGCSPSCATEPGWICDGGGPMSCRPDTFDVIGAISRSNHQIEVTFSAPPEPVAALTLANYMVPSLMLSGTPVLAGSKVTLTTSSQMPTGYDVIVQNVTRASDAKPLSTTVAPFGGRPSFDVMSAASTSDTQVVVMFNAPPDPAAAATAANYTIGNLTVIGTPVLAGTAVTLTTSMQMSQSYTVAVANVTRASDGEPLGAGTATFSGRDGFDVATAESSRNRQIVVTFNGPPNAAQATNAANYSAAGLVLSAPVLAGNTVTLTTSAQTGGMMYMVAVANVTRASDGSTLSINMAPFTGTPIVAPLVQDVAIITTVPNNGVVPYNTGTTTIRITGIDFATVTCPAGVKLDDRDGGGAAVNTVVTSCTVDSDNQITAVVPAGVRTNGVTGWNVIVTNMVGSNVSSDVPFVPRAGLLISEVYVGSSAASDHQFVELYNPTATALDTGALGVRLHIRSAAGADVAPPLTSIHTAVPSHGFFLFASGASASGDLWFAHRDATYKTNGNGAVLVPDGGVCISLSATSNAKVLDKVGWGASVAGSFEGTAAMQIPPDQSIERLPAGGMGHATDTDVNALDFTAPSTTITPRGTADPPQP